MASKAWGPPLWRILHGLAECLGKQPVPMLATDEAHEIVFLLRDVEKIMPCQLCRSHYHQWRKDHPLEQIDVLRGGALRVAVREWIYGLHEEVNTQRGTSSGISQEQLPELYGSVEFKEAWSEFFSKVKASTEIGLVSQTVLQAFHRRLGMLRKLLGKY
jgi:hypothetical protein